MPNRIIRESALTSATLFRLSDGAERLFWRLTLVADDFGRFEADPQILKARCFPRWPDGKMPARKVAALYAELEAELVTTYAVNGTFFGIFNTWERYQHRRAKTSKYPAPADASTCEQMRADSPEESRNRGIEESRNRGIEERDNGPDGPAVSLAHDVLRWLNDRAGRNYRAVPVNLALIRARLKDGITADQLKAIVSRKVREWQGDPKTARWLRPATLFGKTKCEQYVGELPKLDPAATA